ncbi:Uncharacterised protein [Burkholderia pseudomallei]|nr:Uncharacterised protein [Burkholderia pseudomallei]CAJ8333049.1 Uncharacterised protein [Burkholderia pseudomallei]VBL63168.1 Uncharacterised protein [Burkholderia pseudomallei]
MRPCGDGPCERARTARRAADGRESGEAASRAAYRAAGEGNRARLRRDVVGSASENGARARRSRLCPRARLAVARSARRRACFDCARDARALNAHANDGAVGDHRSEAGTPVAPPSAIRFVADLANRRDRACARRSHRDAANRATGLIDAQRAARSFAGESNVWTPCGRHRRNRFGSGALDLSAAFGWQVDGDRFIRSVALIDRRCRARDCNDVRARARIAAVRKVEKPRRQPVYIGRRAAGAPPGRAGAWTRGEHVDDVSTYRRIDVSTYRRIDVSAYRRIGVSMYRCIDASAL